MKYLLTKEDLKFIDRYLINSGVNYIDIRVEMLDHIATDIEATLDTEGVSFYEAFRAYMAHHKKELLESNRKLYRQIAVKKVFKALKKKLLSFVALSILGILFFGFSILSQILEAKQFQWVLEFFPPLVMGIIMLCYIIFFRSVKGRYSVFETLGLYFLITYFTSQAFLSKKVISVFGTAHEFLIAKLVWSVWGLFVLLLLMVAFELKQYYRIKFEI